MISLCAAFVRAALRLYTYPKRKKFASLSRSVTLKNKPYRPPRGLGFARRQFGGVRVEILTPPYSRGSALQFHGGGHTVPMNDMYRRMAERLAKACRITIYSIDYSTGAQFVYPFVHEECFAAYAALCGSVLAGQQFAAFGDSFGVGLLLSVCLRARENGLPLPQGLVCVSPFVDMAASGSSYRENCHRDPLYALPKRCGFEQYENRIRRISPYCGETPPTDPYLSPVYADLYGFPRTLIQCGGLETSLSDGKMLSDALRRGGSEVKLHIFGGMWHDFCYLFPRLKESREALREIARFLFSVFSASAE